MIEVVKISAAHVSKLKDKGALTYLADYVTPERLVAMEKMPEAFTALHEGDPIACGGLIEIWPGRAEAWAFFDPKAGKCFTALHRIALRLLEIACHRRIEATVDLDFPAGHKWIKMLGFKKEAERLKSYTVDGRDSALYARIKERI